MIYLFLLLATCTAGDIFNEVVNSDEVILEFKIHQEQSIYKESIYGEPPQFAIWLEDVNTRKIQTVVVTRKTGTGDFEGKARVPVALPAWIEAFRRETGRDDFPTPDHPVTDHDIISRPTPKISEFSYQIRVSEDLKWRYYVEVNVAGDFTSEFSSLDDNGAPDRHGNGQPSIVYRGEIISTPGNRSTPDLIGRTRQMYFSPEIIPDLKNIGSAQKVFREIKVICKKIDMK